MTIRAVPVGCIPRGRYGSRIGLIRRTEINLGSFDTLFLFNLFLAVDWIIYLIGCEKSSSEESKLFSNNSWPWRFLLSYNWPTFDKWRIWEHDHYFHTCQEKQAFLLFLLFIYFNVNSSYINKISTIRWDRRDRDRMVVGFLTIYAISAYHH